jgi:hypothetical protein
MSGKRVEPRSAYPALREWNWPTPGVRTWTPPAKSFFGPCTGTPSCSSGASCPVGVITTLSSGPHSCDCPCHDTLRSTA